MAGELLKRFVKGLDNENLVEQVKMEKLDTIFDFDLAKLDEFDLIFINMADDKPNYIDAVIDAIGTNVSYGICSCWGDDPNNHWESWSQIYVKDDRLWLDDPVTQEPMCIKVLHQAGGSIAGELNKSHGGFRNWLSSVVSDDVNDYLNEVQNG